ncbi:hypothetical protein ACWDV4_17335 [Micromonospora sp. NPDC003197]
MDVFLFAFYALAYVVLLAWLIRLGTRHGFATPSVVVLPVVAGLLYDNGLIALGAVVGEGPLLENLNLVRFWSHALLTPLLTIFAWDAVRRAGVRWAGTRIAAAGAILLTLALVAIELVTELAKLTLEPTLEYGTLRYTPAESDGPPIMVLTIALVQLIASVIVFRKQRWPWFMVGAALMIVASAVPLPLPTGAMTNLFELILLTSLVATKTRQDRQSASASVPTAPATPANV